MWGPRPLTVRRFRSLIRGIPLHDSRTGVALDVRQAVDWGHAEELLAGLLELVDHGNRLFFSAHAKKGTSAPKPIKVHRPKARSAGETPEEPERRQATSEELRAFFGGAVRYTGDTAALPAPAPPRCERGHYVAAGAACVACVR